METKNWSNKAQLIKILNLSVIMTVLAGSVYASPALEQLEKEAAGMPVSHMAAPAPAAGDIDETRSGSYDPIDANRDLIDRLIKHAADKGGILLEGSLQTVKALGSERTERVSCVLNGRTLYGLGELFLTCGGRELPVGIRNLDDNDGTYHRSLVREEGGVIYVRTRMYHGGNAFGDYPVNAMSAAFDSATLAPLSIQARITENSHIGKTKQYTLSPVR